MPLSIPPEVTLSQLAATSGALQSQIGGSTAGVGGLNGLTGQVLVSGRGTVGITAVGQALLVSGDSSISGFVLDASGALQAQIAGGGSQVRVTGSSTIAIPDFTGLGGTLVIWSGSQVFISGAAAGGGGAGDVTQAQLTGVSGWVQNPPITPLQGGTVLRINNVYTDGFNTNRTFTFAGTSGDSSWITLYANITNACTLYYPISYRLGQYGATTGTFFAPGTHQINWSYASGRWTMADSASTIANLAANYAPTGYDDMTTGYGVGSQWLHTGVTGLYYCTSAIAGAAVWKRIAFM
jgi:hypothetical protein